MGTITLKKFHIPGAGWFIAIGIILYAAPYLVQIFWPAAPPSAIQLTLLICGIIAKSIDVGKPDDRDKLMQIIQHQEQELNKLAEQQAKTDKQASEAQSATAIESSKPTMRGSKPTVTVTRRDTEGAVYAATTVEAPSKTQRWLWG